MSLNRCLEPSLSPSETQTPTFNLLMVFQREARSGKDPISINLQQHFW